ncbi:uncharacterized protein LOC121875263 [Homarus americanus]|uniref:uncharacterized protein LOC121875263 n=1 Tax=Homarus americanus TaxID=6706 RepID=UPI001C44E096|nr:uncharacterized protein LOC121875263 [Homarus americanus]
MNALRVMLGVLAVVGVCVGKPSILSHHVALPHNLHHDNIGVHRVPVAAVAHPTAVHYVPATTITHHAPAVAAVAHHAPAVTAVTHHGPAVAPHAPTFSAVTHHAPAVTHHAPAVVHASLAPVNTYSAPVAPATSQYHAQDEYGRYSFGYNAGNSARDESRDIYGNVRGSYSYVDGNGNLQTQHYVADDYGFRVAGNNLPVQHSDDHPYRGKRSYATFPASTGPLRTVVHATPAVHAAPAVHAPALGYSSGLYGYGVPRGGFSYGYHSVPSVASYRSYAVPAYGGHYFLAPRLRYLEGVQGLEFLVGYIQYIYERAAPPPSDSSLLLGGSHRVYHTPADMNSIRVLCVLWALVGAVTSDGTHHGDTSSSSTIFRDSVVRSNGAPVIGKGVFHHHTAQAVHGASVAHGGSAIHGGSAVHGASGVHGGSALHGGSAVHGASVVHGGSAIHGGSAVQGASGVHGGSAIHGGSAVHGASGVHGGSAIHGGSAVHGASGVHGGSAFHGGSAVHGASVVHGGSAIHGGSAVQGASGVHGGSSFNGGSGSFSAPVVRKTTVVHGGPVLHAPVVHRPVVSAPVVRTRVVAPAVVHAPVAPVAVGYAPYGLVAPDPVIHQAAMSGSYGRPQYAPVLSQYHAQDEYGRYSFGYNAGNSARDESRDVNGHVRGSFSYIDDYGNIQTQHYVADDYGFRVAGNNLPVQHSDDHPYRGKRSYTNFPASTSPLISGSSHGAPATTVTHVVNGPVVVRESGPYGGAYVQDNSRYGVYSTYSGPHGGYTGISPLLGNSDLHGDFDRLGLHGFSYGFNTGPHSLTTYGTHFEQQNQLSPYRY